MFNKIKEMLFSRVLHDDLIERCVKADFPIDLEIKDSKKVFHLIGHDENQIFLTDPNDDHAVSRVRKEQVVIITPFQRKRIEAKLRKHDLAKVKTEIIDRAQRNGWCSLKVEDYDTDTRFRLEMNAGLTKWRGSYLLTLGEAFWIFSVEHKVGDKVCRLPVTEFIAYDGITI